MPTSTGILASSEGASLRSSKFADFEHILLAQISNDIDRVQLNDFRELSLLFRAVNNIARINEMFAHEPIERRAHVRIAEIEFGDIGVGVGGGELDFRFFGLKIPIVDHHLRGRAFFAAQSSGPLRYSPRKALLAGPRPALEPERAAIYIDLVQW
jgi:hypothetical protein